jgi:hypothetical protein
MSEVIGYKSFQDALSALPVSQQRQVGARFIEHVLDLTDEPRLRDAQLMAAKSGVSAEELVDAFHSVHAIYSKTHPRSDLSELDYTKQAVHFIAEACLVCLSPTYQEATIQRIAEKAALYCRMARTCASIMHDADQPELGESEKALQDEIKEQYRIVNDFLNK